MVAVPVRNEGDRIVDCLRALADQTSVEPSSIGILLFLNNCTDGTRDLVAEWAPRSPCPLRVIERDSEIASAGWARREAMDAAADWLDHAGARDGLILTTDADSRVPREWLALNRAALDAGADAVAGRVMFDDADMTAFSASLQARLRLEARYEMLLAEVESRLAPRRGDPWPCHRTQSGASLAVGLDAYRRVGGIPRVDSGEDRAFVDLMRAQGFVVRHAPDIVVITSGRLDGRARDGAADTLKRIGLDPHSPCDGRLERLAPFVLRLAWFRLMRRASPPPKTSSLSHRAVRPYELLAQIRRASLLLRFLRALEARRGDSRSSRSELPGAPPKRLSTP